MLAAAADLPYRYSAGDDQQQGDYYNETSGRWDGALARKLSAYAVLAHLAAWQANYPDAPNYSKFVLDNYQPAPHDYISTATQHRKDSCNESKCKHVLILAGTGALK